MFGLKVTPKEDIKISVVIPSYNVSKHIAEVINGLPPEISFIIVVDDCSTDTTQSVLKQLVLINPKIHILVHLK